MTRRPTIAALLAPALAAACGASHPAPTAPAAAPGPVQALTVTGSPVLAWSASTDPVGVVGAAPGASGGTGCYAWGDTSPGGGRWAARITGTSGGHALVLDLSVSGQRTPPIGTHTTVGPPALDGGAVLTVDGTAYQALLPDPVLNTPSYFTLDGDGTTGQVSIRFAATAQSPQTYQVQGRWHCT